MNSYLAGAIEMSMDADAIIELLVSDIEAAILEIKADGWCVDRAPYRNGVYLWGRGDQCSEAVAWRLRMVKVYLPVLRVHEVAADVYVEAAVLNLPITRREANILASYIVTEQAARTVPPPSFLPVLHQGYVAAELFVMLTLIGRDRWTWDEVYAAAWGYVQQLRIRQPFYTYSPPAWRRP